MEDGVGFLHEIEGNWIALHYRSSRIRAPAVPRHPSCPPPDHMFGRHPRDRFHNQPQLSGTSAGRTTSVPLTGRGLKPGNDSCGVSRTEGAMRGKKAGVLVLCAL